MLLIPTFFHPVAATAWVGNDDGEFGWYTLPTATGEWYNGIAATISNNLAWNNYPCTVNNSPSTCNQISLQFNPDLDQSASSDNNQWFQTGQVSDSNSCALDTVQVYNTTSGANLYYWSYPQTGCVNQPGILNANSNSCGCANWAIDVDMQSNNLAINEVNFEFCGTGCGGPPGPSTQSWLDSASPWKWVNSNECWCGVNRGSVQFTSGAGDVYADTICCGQLTGLAPPTDIATAENSNMQYGCWSAVGIEIYQPYGLSGSCGTSYVGGSLVPINGLFFFSSTIGLAIASAIAGPTTMILMRRVSRKRPAEQIGPLQSGLWYHIS